jgi:hypothetical protein
MIISLEIAIATAELQQAGLSYRPAPLMGLKEK